MTGRPLESPNVLRQVRAAYQQALEWRWILVGSIVLIAAFLLVLALNQRADQKRYSATVTAVAQKQAAARLTSTSEGNHYLLEIDDGAQKFRIVLRYNNEWKTLKEWTSSPLIRPGEANRLSVHGEGSHFALFINDQFVAEFEDAHLARGETGLAISLDNAGDQAVSEFDDFRLVGLDLDSTLTPVAISQFSATPRGATATLPPAATPTSMPPTPTLPR